MLVGAIGTALTAQVRDLPAKLDKLLDEKWHERELNRLRGVLVNGFDYASLSYCC
jgi:hypothetical protein